MAEGKKSFIAYCEWIEIFEVLEDDEAGRLAKHLWRYVNDQNPVCDDKIVKISFTQIRNTLKRDLVKYNDFIEKQKINGAKGGRPQKPKKPKKPKPFSENPNKPKKADNDNDNDNDNVSVIDYKRIEESYSLYCEKLSQIKKLSDERKKHINARFREFDFDTIILVIKKVGESDFLNGKNDRNWKPDFDWIFKPTNFVKILEGKYDNKLQSKPRLVQ